MKIGIDIDGVLTDIEQWQLDYGSKYFYEHYNKEIINYKGYETIEIFEIEDKIDNKFWKKYFKDYSKNVDVRKFASEVIEKLKRDGNEIYIITARGSFLSHSADVMSIAENQDIVLNWLKENNIYYDKIVFDVKNKGEYCQNNCIDIMIEDDPNNLRKLIGKTNIIIFDYPYNRNFEFDNITRAYSWYDIYYKIRNIKEYKNDISNN